MQGRSENIKQDRFTDKMYFRLWLPAVISSLGWALSDMADAVVVGQRLGGLGLAAIGLILPVYMVNCLFAHSFGLGGSVKYARLLSEGKVKEAVVSFNQVLQNALLLSVLIALAGHLFMPQLLALLGTVPADGALYKATRDYLVVLVSAAPLFFLTNILNYYLRNDDNARKAGVGSLAGNISDIALSVLFVLGLGLGTKGAAMATAVGQVVAIAIYLPGIFGKNNVLRAKIVRPSLKEGTECFRNGFASSVTYLFQLVFILLANNILMRMSGETGVMVFDMIQNASYLILYLYEGTTRGLQPLLSTYFGEHNLKGSKRAMNLGLGSGCAAGAVVIAFVELFPELICALFGIAGGETGALACMALRIYAFGAFFGGISILIICRYQSEGMERRAFLLTALRGSVVLLPCMVLFALGGIKMFWWLFPVTEIGSLIIFASVIAFSGKGVAFDEERIFTETIGSSNEDVGGLIAHVREFCEKWDAKPSQTYLVTMSVEEICLAVMAKGFGAEGGYICVTLVADKSGDFELHIRYNALRDFDPFSLHAKKASLDEELDMNALGMQVIRKKVKEFFYRKYQGFDTLVVKI